MDTKDVKTAQTPGGKTGSSSDLPTKGVTKGAKNTAKRVDSQEKK